MRFKNRTRGAFLNRPERAQWSLRHLGLTQAEPLSLIHAGQGRLGKQMLAGLALDVAA